MTKRIDIISMGCSKNLIDSERLYRRLDAKGYETHHDSDDICGDYVVVNTCGFINDAKEESINMILQLCDMKRQGRIGKVIVMGCLSERYLEQLRKEIPEVDCWYGKFDWKDFVDSIPDCSVQSDLNPKSWERHLTTGPSTAYLKISEGCNRFCAFCAIPLITGRHTSRPIEEIIEETKSLVGSGIKEFNIIAQDLSSYGCDIYGRSSLARLVEAISDVPGVEWIRLHYAYPSDFPYDLLDVMRKRDNVCKYLDIALQHISDPVLANMRRHITKEETLTLIEEIRHRVPGIRIRTTLMVGFPGEGEQEFQELLQFVKDVRFDRMGAFAYCEEDDTWAAKNLDDNIPEDVKHKRLQTLMDLQEEISLDLNRQLIGSHMRVIVDRHEGDTAVCRSEYDSPDVDPEILVSNCKADAGEFINVIITDAYPFELAAELENELI